MNFLFFLHQIRVADPPSLHRGGVLQSPVGAAVSAFQSDLLNSGTGTHGTPLPTPSMDVFIGVLPPSPGNSGHSVETWNRSRGNRCDKNGGYYCQF